MQAKIFHPMVYDYFHVKLTYLKCPHYGWLTLNIMPA